MKRAFSTFAMAGWAGYHGVAAALIAASLSGPGVTAPGSLAALLSNAPLAATLALAHALLAAVSFGLVVAFRCAREDSRAEAHALLAMLGGAALVSTAFLAGAAGAAPGTYGAFIAATLIGLAFDRALADEAEEVDHAAFMREAGRLGARMAPGRDNEGEGR